MVILYSIDLSPPCRAVLMTAKVINLALDVHETNLFKEEHKTDKFIKLNPQHTVPTIDDDGFILWDSHAIIRYLVSKNGKDDSLYPKDLQKRAIIDQRMHFEGEMLFVRLRNVVRPVFYNHEKQFNEENVKLAHEACEILDKFLEGNKWLTGDNFTLADISCVSTVSCYPAFLSLDKFKNVVPWLKRCETEIPGYAETNTPGQTKFIQAIKSIMQS